MAFRSGKNIVVGLDVGTTKICATVAEIDREGRIRIIGIGTSPSHGLRKGVVVNVESTVDSIGRAIDEAEEMSGVEIHSVFAGIAGGHIKSMNSRGVIPISRESNEITQADIDRAVNSAKAISIPMGRTTTSLNRKSIDSAHFPFRSKCSVTRTKREIFFS